MRTLARAWLAIGLMTATMVVPPAVRAEARTAFPDRIELPAGFRPEGIAIDRSGTAYFGSRVDGDIYAADLRTGFGAVISQGPGTESVGLKVDHSGRIYVAGGAAGTGRVVNSHTGEIVRTYRFTSLTSAVNDVVLAKRFAWFTDSAQAQLYGVPLRSSDRGAPARTFVTLPLRGQWVQSSSAFANGIETTPDGAGLLVVQTGTGLLFRVNPVTGVAKRVDLGRALLIDGDGLLREGRTLYVVLNQLNTVAVVCLDAAGRHGRLVARLTSPQFDVPTTLADYRNSLYTPNSRVTTPPTPATEYWATRIHKPSLCSDLRGS